MLSLMDESIVSFMRGHAGAAHESPGLLSHEARTLISVTLQHGSERVDVPYLWPSTLALPERPPKLIYLDLNHWIELANAHAGRRGSASHTELLAALSDAVNRDAAVFPLSDTIYYEVCKMASHDRRRELREVMELLSRYLVVASRSDISTHEIEAMLDQLVGPSPMQVNTMPYLDWGVARAFGHVGGFRVRDSDDDRDVIDDVRASWPGGPEAFNALFASAELLLNRQVLDGPSNVEEEAHLRTLGYDRTGHMTTAQRRAEQEIEQVGRFDDDPNWRRGRIRDVVGAREVIIELFDAFTRGLTERGATLEALFPSPDEFRQAFDALPSFDVAVTLKTSYHRDANHRWTVNDVADIDALGSTLPYCDMVVTDKAIANHSRQTGLTERLGTVVTSQLTEVVDFVS